ncbi:protein tyrosine phosphatase [Bombyx mori]|uniref:Protein tyrosine phosphatase n=1 Tax=Bombyx mori TaxID=7091 RepID=Q75T82_BOMMO|nr:protein tyrosine phosphatase [Bombyx mori]BAD02367.1 protein tyrosine phosphatase [Bombyx mori]
MPKLPDRWIKYNACGRVIEGTRIICFKVPLSKSQQVQKSQVKKIWDIPALLEAIPKLGAVIDLTNTDKYYKPEDVKAAGILHKKIIMPGRILPPENKVKEFMDAVDDFLGKDSDILLGVHCTHGLNRTGYMVCRYMRDRLGMSGKEAIKKFERARGYAIERIVYTSDLLKQNPAIDKERTNSKSATKRRRDFEYRSPLAEEYETETTRRRYR